MGAEGEGGAVVVLGGGARVWREEIRREEQGFGRRPNWQILKLKKRRLYLPKTLNLNQIQFLDSISLLSAKKMKRLILNFKSRYARDQRRFNFTSKFVISNLGLFLLGLNRFRPFNS